jgi:hypothetical protein
MPDVVRTPWSEDQLASLRGYQTCGYLHPYTCGRCGSLLYVEADGWRCSGDDYAQDWAHRFSTDWSWRTEVSTLPTLLLRLGPDVAHRADYRCCEIVRSVAASAVLDGLPEFGADWLRTLHSLALGETTTEEVLEEVRRRYDD